MSILAYIDGVASLALAFLVPHISPLTSIFRILSFEGSSAILWAVVLAVILGWELANRHAPRVFLTNLVRLLLTLTCTLAIVGLSVHLILKPLAGRPRPYVQMNVEAPHCPTDSSFPSGHAAVAWAGAYVLTRFDHKRRRWIIYYLLAIAISYSRIYLLCHYLGDVVAGAVYGVVVAWLCIQVIRSVVEKKRT